MALAADAMFIEAEPLGIDFEEFVLCFPELAFAAHALAKDAGVQLAAARVADAIQYSVGLCWQLLAQTFFEIRSHAAG